MPCSFPGKGLCPRVALDLRAFSKGRRTRGGSRLSTSLVPRLPEESTTSGDRVDCGRKVRVESGYFSLEKTKQDVKAEEQQLPPPLSPPSPGAPFPTTTSHKTSTRFPSLACPEPGSVSPEGLSSQCDRRALRSGLAPGPAHVHTCVLSSRSVGAESEVCS